MGDTTAPRNTLDNIDASSEDIMSDDEEADEADEVDVADEDDANAESSDIFTSFEAVGSAEERVRRAGERAGERPCACLHPRWPLVATGEDGRGVDDDETEDEEVMDELEAGVSGTLMTTGGGAIVPNCSSLSLSMSFW